MDLKKDIIIFKTNQCLIKLLKILNIFGDTLEDIFIRGEFGVLREKPNESYTGLIPIHPCIGCTLYPLSMLLLNISKKKSSSFHGITVIKRYVKKKEEKKGNKLYFLLLLFF